MFFIVSIPIIILFLAFAIISLLLSAAETAVIGLSKIRLRHMVRQGVKGAQSIQRLVSKFDKFITSVLIGNNFVNIAMSAIATAICVSLFGYKWGVLISAIATTFFVLIFCEITPKILAAKHTERVALFLAPIMEVLTSLFEPLARVFIGISNLFLWILRIPTMKRSPLITVEELRLMIEVGKEEGVLSDEERKMLHRIFEFGSTKVKDVMVPTEKIIAVNVNVTSDELVNKFVEEGHARLPVYAGTLDNIIGIIYARDLLYILRDKGLFLLQDLIHKPYTISSGCRVNELLRKFQQEKVQIAIVMDDRIKKTVGLVTLEDLIEEIVGEIEEVHPARKPRTTKTMKD